MEYCKRCTNIDSKKCSECTIIQLEGVELGMPSNYERKKDAINPEHYKNGKVECIDALESATVNKKGIEAICTANAIKYLWRYESKNGIEDVKKAQWYINKLIEKLESDVNE